MSKRIIKNIGIVIGVLIVVQAIGSIVFHFKGEEIISYICGPRVTIQAGPPTVTKEETCSQMTVMLIVHGLEKVIRSQKGCRCITEINNKGYVSLQDTPEKCLEETPPPPKENKEGGEIEL